MAFFPQIYLLILSKSHFYFICLVTRIICDCYVADKFKNISMTLVLLKLRGWQLIFLA